MSASDWAGLLVGTAAVGPLAALVALIWLDVLFGGRP